MLISDKLPIIEVGQKHVAQKMKKRKQIKLPNNEPIIRHLICFKFCLC